MHHFLAIDTQAYSRFVCNSVIFFQTQACHTLPWFILVAGHVVVYYIIILYILD